MTGVLNLCYEADRHCEGTNVPEAISLSGEFEDATIP